jgi:hypothetical protein
MGNLILPFKLFELLTSSKIQICYEFSTAKYERIANPTMPVNITTIRFNVFKSKSQPFVWYVFATLMMDFKSLKQNF